MRSFYLFSLPIIVLIMLTSGATGILKAQRPGNCIYSEGQFLFTTSWGETMYAHYYNGTLYAAYQDNTNFRPRHWLIATGQMNSNTANCFAEDDPHNGASNPSTPPTTSGGTCNYTEGQYLLNNGSEAMYAHFYNGILYAGYQDGGNFRPQHWLVATGQMTTAQASCFAENDPHTSTSTPTTPTNNPNPTPTQTGGCAYSEGQYLFTFGTEAMYARYYNNVLYAAYQDGSNFKPRHWLVATGLMTISQASCFTENNPHTLGTIPITPTAPSTPTAIPPAGNDFAGSLDWANCNAISG